MSSGGECKRMRYKTLADGMEHLGSTKQEGKWKKSGHSEGRAGDFCYRNTGEANSEMSKSEWVSDVVLRKHESHLLGWGRLQRSKLSKVTGEDKEEEVTAVQYNG